MVAIGCTGGRHRSVVVAEDLAARYRDRDDVFVEVVHRDIDKQAPRRVFDHVGFEVADLQRSAAFYDAIFFPLGIRRMFESAGRDRLRASTTPASGSTARGREPQATASATSPSRRAAGPPSTPPTRPGCAAGGRSDGPPGPRRQYGPRYYAAYLLDPDGLRIEVVSGSR